MLVALAIPMGGNASFTSGANTSATYATGTLATPTNFTCDWINATQIQFNWTDNSPSFTRDWEFVVGFFPFLLGYASPAGYTYTHPNPTTDQTYVVNAQAGSWKSSNSSQLRSKNCKGAVNNVAGTGTASFSGDGGAATSATLNAPYFAVNDSLGNTYISDTTNKRIRKVNASDGKISTIAGTGADCTGSVPGCGDGGAATSATFNSPTGLAYFNAGIFGELLYIADSGAHRVRLLVLNNGTISTFAGTGTAGNGADGVDPTSSALNDPVGLDLNSAGNLYIAVRANNKIRKVAGGVITTVAGTGVAGFAGDGGAATSATFRSPRDVVVMSNGDFYIADTNNHKIRKVAASTGNISTVAGTGTGGGFGFFSGDGGPATDAWFSFPFTVDVDSSGQMYIGDGGNKRIRLVNSSGVVSTIMGDGTATNTGNDGPAIAATMSDPRGVRLDLNGDLLIGNKDSNQIRRIML